MTGSAGRYAELAAAVRSFKADLTREEQIERYMEAGSLSETVSLLTSGKLTISENGDVLPVESYLTNSVMILAETLAGYAPYDSRGLIQLIARRYEFECVKQVLQSIINQVEPNEALRHIVPTGRFNAERCKELIEGRNPARVVDGLNDEKLKHLLFSRLTEKNSQAAIASVDQYYFTKIWSASNLPDPLDSQSARGLIGEMIDHLNIILALRARLTGLDARSTSEILIPIDHALSGLRNELAEASNFANVMRVIEKTKYSRAFQGHTISEGDSVEVERLLNRSHAQSCLNTFAGSPFSVSLALALLFLKNYELHDLLSVINGKANNFPTDRIRESLILWKIWSQKTF